MLTYRIMETGGWVLVVIGVLAWLLGESPALLGSCRYQTGIVRPTTFIECVGLNLVGSIGAVTYGFVGSLVGFIICQFTNFNPPNHGDLIDSFVLATGVVVGVVTFCLFLKKALHLTCCQILLAWLAMLAVRLLITTPLVVAGFWMMK